MSLNHCAVQGCKITNFSRPPGISLHTCPTSNEMRNMWLHALKHKCALLDWSRSKICSKHFENKYFDSQRRLKENAIPTIFRETNKIMKNDDKGKIDRLMNKLTQSELTTDIKNTLKRLKEPPNLDKFVTDELKCKIDAPIETQLWLIIKKQDHLNNRLLEHVVQNKKHTEILQKSMEETRTKSARKDSDQSVETYKYIVKCLQEKLATLEEQIEILTAVESR